MGYKSETPTYQGDLASTWYDSQPTDPSATARPLAMVGTEEQTGFHGMRSEVESHPDALEGSIVAGRYRIESRLGSGSFGRVHSAWDLQLRRRVAVKLSPSHSHGELSDAEARLQAVCQHPHIMPLFDAGADPLLGLQYLVMPLYPGATLADALKRFGPLPYHSVRSCVGQISEALEFLLQRRGALHGDVKPANIWLTPGGTALLMDFNLYGLLAREDHLRVGTPGYTAPEALDGQVGPHSDLFSLGCVLYECLTGTQAFADDAAVRSGRFRPVRQYRPDVWREVETVVHTALAHELPDRYASARELQVALRSCRRTRTWRFPWRFLIWMSVGCFRGGWRLSAWFLRFAVQGVRHARRRPRQALVEGVVFLLALRWALALSIVWINDHPFGAVIALCLLALAAMAQTHERWRRHNR